MKTFSYTVPQFFMCMWKNAHNNISFLIEQQDNKILHGTKKQSDFNLLTCHNMMSQCPFGNDQICFLDFQVLEATRKIGKSFPLV